MRVPHLKADLILEDGDNIAAFRSSPSPVIQTAVWLCGGRGIAS